MPARRISLALLCAGVLLLLAPAPAGAHARISPAVSLAGQLQLYSLAVPTEKSGASTVKVVLSVPAGFGIDSFAPPPVGWHEHLKQTGSGDNSVVTQVSWTGGHTPTGEDSLFQFLAQPASPQKYVFQVQQTYSDGSIVNWSGPESSEAPAPDIEVVRSLGGGSGGLSALNLVALILGALGLLAGGLALSSSGPRGGSRPLV